MSCQTVFPKICGHYLSTSIITLGASTSLWSPSYLHKKQILLGSNQYFRNWNPPIRASVELRVTNWKPFKFNGFQSCKEVIVVKKIHSKGKRLHVPFVRACVTALIRYSVYRKWPRISVKFKILLLSEYFIGKQYNLKLRILKSYKPYWRPTNAH